jgi:hypothetical protein
VRLRLAHADFEGAAAAPGASQAPTLSTIAIAPALAPHVRLAVEPVTPGSLVAAAENFQMHH